MSTSPASVAASEAPRRSPIRATRRRPDNRRASRMASRMSASQALQRCASRSVLRRVAGTAVVESQCRHAVPRQAVGQMAHAAVAVQVFVADGAADHRRAVAPRDGGVAVIPAEQAAAAGNIKWGAAQASRLRTSGRSGRHGFRDYLSFAPLAGFTGPALPASFRAS